MLAFPMDVQVLLLSHKTSLVHADVIVPWKSSIVPNTDGITEAQLNQVRMFIGAARLLSVDIVDTKGDSPTQTALVAARKAGASVEYLHYIITLARVMALSFGQTELSADIWAKVTHLEQQRRNRNPPRSRADIEAHRATQAKVKAGKEIVATKEDKK